MSCNELPVYLPTRPHLKHLPVLLLLAHLLLSSNKAQSIKITSLTRYAIKGLSGDRLSHVHLEAGETFPDDRRYGLIKRTGSNHTGQTSFDPKRPRWIHKENFLCAFSAPELMSTFYTEYKEVDGDSPQRLFTVWKRRRRRQRHDEQRSQYPPLLGPVDIATSHGRKQVSQFFTQACGECVDLVTQTNTKRHTHQFGNTRSGVKVKGDTRTIHIINAATVREISQIFGIKPPLRPSRFRPNIILDGLEPWKEFDFVGKTLEVVPSLHYRLSCCEGKRSNSSNNSDTIDSVMSPVTLMGLKLEIIQRTVRCEGVSIDPLDDPETRERLDIPKLLVEHYPQYGPYLGVYAVVLQGGEIGVGDELRLIA